MPIGARGARIAQGPSIGPRLVDPAAARAAPGVGMPGAGDSIEFGIELQVPTSVRLPPAYPLSLPIGTIDERLWSGPGILLGWSLGEAAAVAATAEIILRDGTDDRGPILAIIGLAADETNREWFGPDGLQFNQGLFVERVSGTTHGAIYHRP